MEFETGMNSNSFLSRADWDGNRIHFDTLCVRPTSRLVVITRHGRRLMAKSLPEHLVLSGPHHDMLVKEFDMMTRLDHPNVVKVFDMANIDGFGDCILMEYISGVGLNDWLETKPSRRECLKHAVDMADALAYCHSRGVCHRDLKPDNVRISYDHGPVKILDFGHGDTADYVIMKECGATIKYGAPEQLKYGISDLKSDVYSLGRLFQLMRLPLLVWPIVRMMLGKRGVHRPSMKMVTLYLKIVWWMSRLKFVIVAMAIVLVALHFVVSGPDAVCPEPESDEVETGVNDGSAGPSTNDVVVDNLAEESGEKVVVETMEERHARIMESNKIFEQASDRNIK